MSEQDRDEGIAPDEILVVRRGPGANCSSIGSALDVLFLSAAAAGVILVTVAAALGDGTAGPDQDRDDREEDGDAREG